MLEPAPGKCLIQLKAPLCLIPLTNNVAFSSTISLVAPYPLTFTKRFLKFSLTSRQGARFKLIPIFNISLPIIKPVSNGAFSTLVAEVVSGLAGKVTSLKSLTTIPPSWSIDTRGNDPTMLSV